MVNKYNDLITNRT